MNFNLTQPCKDCPFRTDVTPYLTKARAREIVKSITDRDTSFSCHKTNSFREDGSTMETKDSEHCAGAMLFLEKQGRANQMMRIAERIGIYNPRKLKVDAPVFGSAKGFIGAQRSR